MRVYLSGRSDGTTHLRVEALELLEKLARLIPRPDTTVVSPPSALATGSRSRTSVDIEIEPGDELALVGLLHLLNQVLPR
jgi:hypothetical protein